MWNSRIRSPFVEGDGGSSLGGADWLDQDSTFVRCRLRAALAGRTQVTVVHGPPGIGKSVLLAHWVDQIREAGHAVIALDADRTRDINPTAFWTAAADALEEQGWPIDRSLTDKREAIKQGMAGITGNLFLIVDNVRDVDRYIDSVEVQELLRTSPRFRTIIASQSEGRHRTSVAYVGPERLLFTAEEAQRCINSRIVSISDSSVHKVMVVLRGWPGLVDITAATLAASKTRHSLESAMQAAIDELCRVLRDDPREVPIDPFLRSTLPAVCLTTALDEQNWALAADVIRQDWVTLAAQHKTLLFTALHAIPGEVVAADRDVDIVHRFLTSRHPSAADEIPLPADREELVAMLDEDNGRVALTRAYTAVNWFRRGARFPDLAEVCDRALVIIEEARRRVLPATTNDLALGYLHVGASHMLLGNFDKAERELKFAVEYAGREDYQLVIAVSAGMLALLYSTQGRIMESAHYLEIEARQVVSGPLTKVIRTAGKTARLINAVESLDHDAASRAYEDIDDPLAELETWPFIVGALCLWHRRFGDPHATLDLVHRLRNTEWHDVPDGSVSYLLLAGAEACSLLSLGQFDLAYKAVAQIDSPLADNIKIRIQIENGDYDWALQKPDLVGSTNTPALRVERLLLSFMANDAVRNRSAAAAALRQALAVSDIAGNYREYLYLPLRLLSSYVSEVPAIRLVIEAIETTGIVDDDLAANTAAELSTREVEVVRSLALHPTYAKVAEHLFVSTSTVKTHVASIHKKLGTRQRADMLRVAASHGLLD